MTVAALHNTVKLGAGQKNALVQGSRRIYRERNFPEDFGFERRISRGRAAH
jgi:hypothetical protein